MSLPMIDEAPKAPPLPPWHIQVQFGDAITGDLQGRALLALERYMRETLNAPVECYKAVMADDLKRRRDMTQEDRRRL